MVVTQVANRHAENNGPAAQYSFPYSRWITSLPNTRPKAISGVASKAR